MQTLVVIDTFNLLFKSYYAMPSLATTKKEPSGMLNGLASFILNIKQLNASHVIFAIDKGPSFRHELYKEYKANRSEAPEALKAQIGPSLELLRLCGFKCIHAPNYEADDVIASLAKRCREEKVFLRIISSDKDLYQLLKDGCCELYDSSKKQLIDEAYCIGKFGVKPSQIGDYLALCGDSSDNIKGVPGIGPVAARKLLNDFGSIENIYKNLNSLSNKRQQKLLLEHKEDAILSQKLTALFCDLELKDFLEGAKLGDENPLNNAISMLDAYELFFIKRRLELEKSPVKEQKHEAILLNNELLEKELKNIEEASLIGFDTETTGLEKDAKIVGFSFALDEHKAFYAPLRQENAQNIDKALAIKALNLILSHKNATVILHNLKFDLNVLERNFDLKPKAKLIDSLMLGWLAEPEQRLSLSALCGKYLGQQLLDYEDLVPKGKHFGQIDIDKACVYASQDAAMTRALYLKLNEIYEKQMPKWQELALFESRFALLLYKIENWGIYLDANKLQELKTQLEPKLKALSLEIYKSAGQSFNLRSPKQVAQVLYEDMQLAKGRKIKTGYSTNEEALQAINHPIASQLLEFRELDKMLATYIEPFLQRLQDTVMGSEDSRVHTTFLQHKTSTGRLASVDPNLQNIPSRKTWAKPYKNCFRAANNFIFASLDYSQIELRMLAHFSGQKDLLKAFENDEDIHKSTALMMFGSCDDELRQAAKSINFGLIYGMGSSRLAKVLDIDIKQAKEYMQRYFSALPGIEEFFSDIRQGAREKGFVSTLLGRRRYFHYQNAEPRLMASYDRECVNAVLQGSAADLIKKAMLDIAPKLSEDCKLILQIHDELIFELKEDLAQDFAAWARGLMENALELRVPLKTSLSFAKSWGDC